VPRHGATTWSLHCRRFGNVFGVHHAVERIVSGSGQNHVGTVQFGFIFGVNGAKLRYGAAHTTRARLARLFEEP
jgi:hypothetical protein